MTDKALTEAAVMLAVLALLCAAWLVKTLQPFKVAQDLFRRWMRLPLLGFCIIGLLFAECALRASEKYGSLTNIVETIQVALNRYDAPPGEGDSQSLSSGPRLSTNQFKAGFALTSATTNNATAWSANPETAILHSRWTLRGSAEETFWLPATNWSFVLGTNTVDGVHVSSDGTLSFWWPKGSPRAAAMPDSSGISFLAPLQGWFGIVPPEGRFWSAPTASNSLLLTWQDALAGRDTNSPVTFQAELFRNGDFTYRYAFTNALALTNFVVGAQHNGGGETYALNDTGLLVNGLELHWRAFGILDPGIDDHDDDGLSTYDEVMKYGTDPTMPDTDLDGLSDSNEVAIGSNPLVRCSRGDGIPDGSNPQSLAWSNADGNTNGLPDAWENYWFGTNGTSGASADDNGDGFSNLANLLTGTNPAKAPPPGFAVTNGIPVTGIDAWEIAPAFALEMRSGLTNILTRTFQATRTSPWQQFFISSKPRAAGAWSLDGLSLSWEGGTNLSGEATASASGDSLRLALSSNVFESLSFRLAPTRTNGLVRSPAPLYLVRWTPLPAFTPGGTIMAATSSNGIPCVAAVLSYNDAPALPFTLDTASRPHKAPATQDELAERSLPPDPGSEVRPVFTAGQTAGYLTAPCPSEAALPATRGNASTRVLLYTPTIISGAGITIDRPLGQLSPPFPLDSAGLRSQWRNNTIVNDSAGSPGFTVSTGLNSEFLVVKINGTVGNTFTWDGGNVSASRMSRAAAPLASACDNGCSGAGVEYSLCNSNGVNQCVERDPDEYTHDDDTTRDDDKVKDDPPCECGDPEGINFGSLKFRIPLGNPGRDRISGFLWFAMETPQPVTRALFNILGDPLVSAWTNDDAVIVTSTAGNGRTLAISNITCGVSVWVSDFNGTLEHRWEIANPPNDAKSVRLVKFDQAGNPVTDETYSHDGFTQWTRADNLTGTHETLDITGNLALGIRRCETRTLYDAGNHVLSKTMAYSDVIGQGDAAVARVTEKYTLSGDGATWLSSFSYYWADSLNLPRNGRLRFRQGNAAPWEYHAYDSRGREVLRATQLDGSASPGEAALRGDIQTAAGLLAAVPGIVCAVQTFSYIPDAASGDSGEYSDSREPRENTSHVIRSGTATVSAREWHVYTRTHGENGSVAVRTVRAASAASAIGDNANAVSVAVAYAGSEEPTVPVEFWGLPLSEQREDGTLLTWAYALDANTLTATAKSGTVANPDGLANVSTYEVETRDAAFGRTLRRETRLYTGNAQGALLAWEENTYDPKGHQLSAAYSDGTVESNIWDCCHLQSKINRDGSQTEYTSIPGNDHWSVIGEFSLGNLPGANEIYPAVETFSDALGRETNSVRRVYHDHNPANNPAYPDLATSTEYPNGSSDYRVTTDPHGVKTVNRKYYGSNSAVEETVAAGVTNKTTQLFGGSTVTEKYWGGKWTRETRSTYRNASGCRVETVTSERSDMPTAVVTSETVFDFLGREVSVTTPLIVTSNTYENGRLAHVSRTGSPDTLCVYDELGNMSATALDVDGNGQISAADLLNASHMNYVQDGGEWWRVTIRAEIRNAATNSAGIVREQLTGLSPQLLSRTVSCAANGQTTTNATTLDTATHVSTTTVKTDGVATPDIRHSLYGYPVETRSSARSVSYDYDGFARVFSQTETTPDGTFVRSVGTVEYDVYGNDVTNRTTYGDLATVETSAYDSQGNATDLTDAAGNIIHSAYDSLGQPLTLSGATYPVAYAYDTARHMTDMTTYRDENAAGDTTHWLYDLQNGWLTNKVFADGASVAYGHTAEGRLSRKTWARGAWIQYFYDGFGHTTSNRYSSSVSTPAASFAYNDDWRLSQAGNGIADYGYAYNTLGTITNESAVIDGASWNLLHLVDGWQRAVGISAFHGPTNVLSLVYGYDGESRIGAVSWTNAAGRYGTTVYCRTNNAIVGYETALDNNNVLRRVIQRDPHRPNLITAVSNLFNSTLITGFQYRHDMLGRITNRTDLTAALNAASAFGYNSRSEVASAVMYTNAYGYVYDPIGNRLFAAFNSVTNSYTANCLNQYTGISGGQTAASTYDQDGNMLTFGEWEYSWDGENRMASAAPANPTNGSVRVEYGYDHRHRRVSTRVRVFTGQEPYNLPSPLGNSGEWVTVRTHTYVFDDWNLIAETVADTNGVIARIEYAWGLDISGSLQGAGGVGGLIAVSVNGEIYLPCYDNNGNITAYVDDQGSVVARYAYDAFGRTISMSGALANTFAFRFSTKYYDAETGLYYYGYRYYSPELGRWLSRDPFAEEGGANLQAFVVNNALNGIDFLGLWKKGQTINGDRRRIYEKESGDTWESLASKVGLSLEEIHKWAKLYENGNSGKDGVPCKVSVPNVWISADLIRGGTLWSRLTGVGGTVGQFMGTDLLTYGFKVEKPTTIQQLASALGRNQKDVWGMVVFGHGNKEGVLAASTSPKEKGVDWIYQKDLLPYVDYNGYRLAKIFMMQCYSKFKGSFEYEDSKGNTFDSDVDYESMWRSRAVEFFGYSGMNVIGIPAPF